MAHDAGKFDTCVGSRQNLVSGNPHQPLRRALAERHPPLDTATISGWWVIEQGGELSVGEVFFAWISGAPVSMMLATAFCHVAVILTANSIAASLLGIGGLADLTKSERLNLVGTIEDLAG